VYGLGAAYSGPLRVEMWIENPSGRTRSVLDCTTTDCGDDGCFRLGGAPCPLPTGGRLDLRVEPLPILPEDGGVNRLFARVTYAGDGGDVVQTAVDTFVVAEQEALQVLLRPNPLRGDPGAAEIVVPLERPGELRVDVYNLEGELVSSRTQQVEPFFQAQEKQVAVPLLSASTSPRALESGVYVVRVRWTGPGGQQESSVARLAVVR
jgi:hypothetical protein